MFLDFLLFLRSSGLKISLHEWLALMDGLRMGLHGQTLRGFFVLSRALLIKKESDLDRFEELFRRYFKNTTSEELREETRKLMERNVADAPAVAEALRNRAVASGALYAEIFGGETAAANGGETAGDGTGIGIGPGAGNAGPGAGGRSIIHASGDRRFRDWRTDCTIESRQFQMAFRLLRELSRKLDSSEEELDIHGTVYHTCARGGILDIRTMPPRKNRLKLMVLIDSGGSMSPYEQLCSLLFQSLNKANTFSDLKIYYFHNYLEDVLYEDPSIDTERTVKTERVLKNLTGDYKVIFVGDADMSISELMSDPYGGSSSSPDGITWFRRFRERYPHSIWLHPQEREENVAWMSESFVEIEKIFPMFRLSIDGLKDGMYRLLKDR